MVHAAGFSLNGVLFASLPFLVGLAANLVGGQLGDRLTLRWGREGSALDSSGLPDADRAGACSDGSLSRKDCGGCAVEPGLWRDGSDAALGVGIVPGDRRAIQWNSYGNDEYRRPGGRLSVHCALRIHRARDRELQPAVVVYRSHGADERAHLYTHRLPHKMWMQTHSRRSDERRGPPSRTWAKKSRRANLAALEREFQAINRDAAWPRHNGTPATSGAAKVSASSPNCLTECVAVSPPAIKTRRTPVESTSFRNRSPSAEPKCSPCFPSAGCGPSAV